MVKANRNFRPTLQGKVLQSAPLASRAPRQPSGVSALRTFLSAHVGAPWLAVRDEYRAAWVATQPRVSPDIFGTLVATNTSMKQGRVRAHLPRAGVVPLEVANSEFYVHPELGTLLRNAHYVSSEQKRQNRAAHRKAELHGRMREMSAHAQAHKIGDIWYRVELGHLPFAPHERGERSVPGQTVFDAVLGRLVNPSDLFDLEHIYGRRGLYGVRRRELSYRELRELGLLPPSRV
ncbi:hypothetical protein WT81_30265 [Burkholderia stagnalis]|uniref:hypothetical protein n=1 Tax=Burkholderia stagnalis TaxID=1503054 RepID=UPI00075FD312|nr:hypothetical protein [Burkholderia stagnalis]KWK49235.1 hypothetical protein WT81_30265 [Burkholderia stagnalis]KWK57367.1 hypothetical protein WT80_30430 [Burkholderia stagnalis]